MPTPESGELPAVDEARFEVLRIPTDVQIARDIIGQFRAEFAGLSEEQQAQIRCNYRKQRAALISYFRSEVERKSIVMTLSLGTTIINKLQVTTEAVVDIIIDLVDPQEA